MFQYVPVGTTLAPFVTADTNSLLLSDTTYKGRYKCIILSGTADTNVLAYRRYKRTTFSESV